MEEDLGYLSGHVEAKETQTFAKLMVVRHAESLANTKGIYQGQSYDTDLSPLGVKQAKALAKRLKEFEVSRIISSPLKRAYQTALEVSKLFDCQIEINNLVMEANHGDWEGKDKDWIRENYKDLYEAWFDKPSSVAFPEGEVFIDTLNRVEAFLQNSYLADGTVLVTHDNIVRIMVTLANGWTLDEIWRHDIEPASLNFFEVNKVSGKNKLKLLKLNDNNHLSGLRADLSKHAL